MPITIQRKGSAYIEIDPQRTSPHPHIRQGSIIATNILNDIYHRSCTNIVSRYVIIMVQLVKLFCPTIFLLAIFCLRTVSTQTTEHEADDYAESGNYHILYCHAGTANSQAAWLQALLPTVAAYIEAVLTDLNLGTASTHGYTAFFKTNNNLDAVRTVYQNMIDGPDVPTAWNGNLSDPYARMSPPTILCANPGEPDTALQYASCTSSGSTIMRVGGVARNTGIISLCPIFFHLPRIARRSACPAVENNKFMSEGLGLARTQYAILVHELAHIYNPGTLVVEERYGIRETVDLDAERSFGNAQNFAFYAAGE